MSDCHFYFDPVTWPNTLPGTAPLPYIPTAPALASPVIVASKQDLDAMSKEIESLRRDIAELKGMVSAILITTGKVNGDVSEVSGSGGGS
jgi:hypothetical protein